jgi:hypothetical protein
MEEVMMNAPLIETMMVDCVRMDKRAVSDGEGGWITEWVEGAPFQAAIVRNNSLNAKVAEKQGVTEVYTVTTNRGIILELMDVFKRVKDGAIFRVQSNAIDSETPTVATFQFEQVSAEKWKLP